MKFFTITFLLFFTIVTFSQNTYIHCGKLIDTKKGKVLVEMTIVVSGEKITAIEKRVSKFDFRSRSDY